MTKVINLLGGSGIGKSSTAAGLFYEMKKEGHSVELVVEFVKKWAYVGKKPGPMDQVYIFAKQARSEYDLYGKVDYIITDSPLILAPIYEIHQQGDSIIESSVFKYLERSQKSGVTHINYLLSRGTNFKQEGRFETQAEARQIDQEVLQYLKNKDISYIDVPSTNYDTRVKFIYDDLIKRKPCL